MLETERLLLRKFTPEDLDKLIETRSDDEVIKYLGGRTLQNPEAIEKRLQFYIDCYEKFGFGMCAMIWKKSGEMIGWSGLQPLEETGETEVGYGMIKEFWGNGIGFECASAWLKYGFETADLERIVAVAQPRKYGFMANYGKMRNEISENRNALRIRMCFLRHFPSRIF